MYLAENIKRLRENLNMTQEELADLIGDITQSAVGNWEAGRREPELEIVVKIAKVFEVSLDDLILQDLKPLYLQNIKYLRKEHEMTQENMANFLGYRGKQGYNAVENGKAKLSVENLEKISDYFGVTMDQLVKGNLEKERS